MGEILMPDDLVGQMKKRFDEIKRLTEEAYTICQQHKDSCANLPETAPEEKFKICPFSGKDEKGDRCLMYAFCNMFNDVFPDITIQEIGMDEAN